MFFKKYEGGCTVFFKILPHIIYTRAEDEDEYDVRRSSTKTIRVRENVRVRRRRGFFNFGADSNLHFYDALEPESYEKDWKFRPLRGLVFVSRRV